MIRKIIKIDKEKCNGCGLCVNACHENAIGLKNGKAELLRDDYCDGLGDCLPSCPVNAISFEEREASAYNEKAVMENKKLPCGCPGTNSRIINHNNKNEKIAIESMLSQWPVQIKLVPAYAPYFNNVDLLVAADCTAYAYGNFHNDFIKNKTVLIGCPKLDDIDYTNKLAEIIANNDINSVTVVRMEVPCCGGLENAVKKAVNSSEKNIPCNVVTISIDGQILK